MSECVVRMEMPKCCEDCAAEYDCMACGITGTLWYESEEFNPSNGRLPDCPIICQLPEGHGRLVDWKDVKNELDRTFCDIVDDVPCAGPYMLKRSEYPQSLIEQPIRVKVIVPADTAERSET